MREMLDFMQKASSDTRRRIQLDYLDRFFGNYVRDHLQSWFHSQGEGLFTALAEDKARNDRPHEERLAFIFEKMAGSMNAKDEPPTAVARFALPINTRYFGDVTPGDIRALPAWQNIHQKARAHDYGLELENMDKESMGPELGGWKSAHITFNMLVSYERGRDDNGDFYPVFKDPPSFMDEAAAQNDNAIDARPSRPSAPHWAPGPGRRQR